MSGILVQNLEKRFQVQDRNRGLWGALTGLIRSQQEKIAVTGLNFSVEAGEMVGLIGPNGAGKSTTIKLLTGILKPSRGTVRIDSLDPWKDRNQHVRQLGVVFGQRTSLWWDLAVGEALELTAAMFDVPSAQYRERLKDLDRTLGIMPLLKRPVRQLSLGERVRCDLVAALLHRPRYLFLDEPTIGLDVAVRLKLRTFLKELRNKGDTTIFLTTHDLAEVQALCPRVLLVAQGQLLHDGPVEALVSRLGGQRQLVVTLDGILEPETVQSRLSGLQALTLLPSPPHELRLQFGPEHKAPELLQAFLGRFPEAMDLKIEEPDIEQLIARFYEDF